VIERLKDELAQQRRPAPELFAPAKRKAAPETDDKSTWMSSAQLWSCGGGLDDSTGNGNGSKKPAPHKVSELLARLNQRRTIRFRRPALCFCLNSFLYGTVYLICE
jgi:hypothetical protein